MHLFLFKLISFFLTQFFTTICDSYFCRGFLKTGLVLKLLSENTCIGHTQNKSKTLTKSLCAMAMLSATLYAGKENSYQSISLTWLPNFNISTIYWKLNLLFDRFCATQNTSLLIVWPKYWIYYTRIAPSALQWRAMGRIFGEGVIFQGVLERRSGVPLPE